MARTAFPMSTALAMAVAACTGSIDGAPGGAGRVAAGAAGQSGGSGVSGTPGPAAPGTAPIKPAATACATSSANVGYAPLRRLTRSQYDNTVRDLLGTTTAPAQQFPEDDIVGNFAVGLAVTTLHAERYAIAAEALARAAVTNLGALLGCQGDDACARTFIRTFGRRAYRRALDDDEVSRLLTLQRAGRDFREGIQVVVTAMLQSPHFLYRPEFGVTSAAVTALTGPELATRLAYFLTATAPDEPLLAAAEAGRLATPEGLEAEARRLLSSPNAAQAVGDFHRQWLGLDQLNGNVEKDKPVFPTWSSALGIAMGEETVRFARHVILEGDARMETLLTAPFSVIDAKLATLYGVKGVTANAFVKTELPSVERAGLLTQGSFLSVNAHPDQTSPTRRGVFVREQFLCQHAPDPPPGLNVDVPAPDPRKTARQRFSDHTQSPACAACHLFFDPIGLTLESYDGIGRFRTTDGAQTMDLTGALTGTADADGPYTGGIELGRKLGRSATTRDCMARQWFVFALGREETPEDGCAMRGVDDVFAASRGNISELVLALVRSDAFRNVRLVVDEGGK